VTSFFGQPIGLVSPRVASELSNATPHHIREWLHEGRLRSHRIAASIYVEYADVLAAMTRDHV
jgi:hypothetical protein